MKKIPELLLAYLPYESSYSQAAIDAFHDVTGRGQDFAMVSRRLEFPDQLGLKELFDAHSVASRVPSELCEGLWAEGQGDYPMRVMLQEMIRDGYKRGLAYWLRYRPLYQRAYRFSVLIHKKED